MEEGRKPYPVMAVVLASDEKGFSDDYDVLGTCRTPGVEWVLVEVDRAVDLWDDPRVCMFCDATVYEEEVPGSIPVDCPNGVVAYVKLG